MVRVSDGSRLKENTGPARMDILLPWHTVEHQADGDEEKIYWTPANCTGRERARERGRVPLAAAA